MQADATEMGVPIHGETIRDKTNVKGENISEQHIERRIQDFLKHITVDKKSISHKYAFWIDWVSVYLTTDDDYVYCWYSHGGPSKRENSCLLGRISLSKLNYELLKLFIYTCLDMKV